MSLRHTLLGFLSLKPFTGYDLKKQFDRTVRHFWTADQAQIYRTLWQLANEGLVAVEIVPGEDRPDRKEYHVTDRGLAELDSWLRATAEMPPDREPFLAQLFFAGRLSPSELESLVERRTAVAEEGLVTLRSVALEWADLIEGGPSTQAELLTLTTLERGIRHHLVELAWLRDLLRDVREQPHLDKESALTGCLDSEPSSGDQPTRAPRSWREIRTVVHERKEKS